MCSEKRSTPARLAGQVVQRLGVAGGGLHPAQRTVPLDQRRRHTAWQGQHRCGGGQRQTPQVQALRLEYYEFFGKFFSGAGQPFEPFRLDAKGGAA